MNIQPDISKGNGVRGPIRGAPDLCSPPHLLGAVAAAFGVAPSDLRLPTRGRQEVARARQAGIYLARMAFGMTLSDAGRLFGRDRTTAAHACRLVEDRRDNPHFDRLLTRLEHDLHKVGAPQ